MKFIKFILLVLLLVRICFCYAAQETWPLIEPNDKTFLVSSGRANVSLLIVSHETQKPIYKIHCNEGNTGAETDIPQYFGMFQCRLNTLGNESPDLFEGTESWSAFWRTRAQFTEAQLLGECKNSKYFGDTRSYSLRGMAISLSIEKFSYPNLESVIKEQLKPNFSFTFKIKVEPINGATDTINPPIEKYCGGSFSLDQNGKLIYQVAPQ